VGGNEDVMGLPLEEVKMEPAKAEEIVHERYHHGRVVGDVDPNKVSAPSNVRMVEVPDIPIAAGMKLVGFIKGHTSYAWTEPE
jgi:hypothetical protein